MEQSTIAILIIALTSVSFVMEKLPIAVTALLASIAMSIFGVISYTDSLSGFGSSTVMMVAGMIVIGEAVFETGLAQTIGDYILKRFGKSEKQFLLVVMLLSSLLSAFLSNTATVALFLPIISTVAAQSNGKITKKHTYMATGFAGVAGGACTLIGAPVQLVSQGILQNTQGVRVMTFFEIGKLGLPMVIIMILYFMLFGYNWQKKVFDFPEAESEIHKGSISDKRSKFKMLTCTLVLAGCVCGFIFELWDVGIIAVLGAAILIMTRCISFKVACDTMDWSTIVVLGSAIGFSKGLDKSGGGKIIADFALKLVGGESASVFAVMVVLVLVSVILGNLMSHTATSAMMTPIAVYLGLAMGIDPMPLVIACVISISNAAAMPIATPPITLTLSGGYRIKDYIKVGGVMTVVRTIALIALLPLIYEL